MKTIFRAVGPSFKQGLLVEPFESVNVYPLMCELLGIKPEVHDGSLEVTRNMLISSSESLYYLFYIIKKNYGSSSTKFKCS